MPPKFIIVVDNGSSINSYAEIKNALGNIPSVSILRNTKNLGFTGGANTGIQHVVEDVDYIALLNNDALADSDWLKELLLVIQQSETIGIVTSLILQTGERHKLVDTAGIGYSDWGLPFPQGRDEVYSSKTNLAVFGASGGASMYSTKMLKQIGVFDNDYFAYYEDIDLSFRARLAGWTICLAPNSIVNHRIGGTSSRMSGLTTKQAFRNLPLLLIRNVPMKHLARMMPKFTFAYTLMLLKALLMKQRKYALIGVLQSIILTIQSIKIRRRNIRLYNKNLAILPFSKGLPPRQIGLRTLLGKKSTEKSSD